MKDLYFEKNYGRLYEEIEGGKCEEFIFRNSHGEVRHLFIKKPIPIKIAETPFYDLVTPYGYGGPIITECTDNTFRTILAEQFHEAFQEYCLDNNIVSEFVRFHPLFSNVYDFKEYYKTALKRNTTGTNLGDFEDPAQKEFSESTRKIVRRALRAGVTYKVTKNPSSLKNFKELYYATMRRNNADSIYFFDDAYFTNCLELLGPHIVLTEVIYQEQTIGMGLSFAYNNLIHTHLSGTFDEYQHLFPSYILQYAIVSWGKENNYTLVHYGGGRTSSSDDKLYKFKKKFGKNTEFDFYYGYKIWNEEIYSGLCKGAGVIQKNSFFPAYRAGIKSATEKTESVSPYN